MGRYFPLLTLFLFLIAGPASAQRPPSAKKAATSSKTGRAAAPPSSKTPPSALPKAFTTPLPDDRPVRPTLTGPLPVSLTTEAVRLEVAGAAGGALSKIWRGLSPNLSAGVPSVAWKALGVHLGASGTALVRLRPFPEGLPLTGAAGNPSPAWEAAGTLLAAVKQAGGNVILQLTPPTVAVTPDAWREAVTQAIRRVGSDPKYGVVRWELAASPEQMRVWYPPFAQAVRAALPATPIGFYLVALDAEEGSAALGDICAQSRAPCDSFAWRVTGDPDEVAAMVRRVRAAFARFPALKRMTLLPDIAVGARTDPQSAAATLVASAAHLAEETTSEPQNPLLGALAYLPTAHVEDLPPSAWNALACLNHVSGRRLNVTSGDRSVHCLAVQTRDGLSVLIWREEDSRPGDVLAWLRLNRLPAAGAWRMERYATDRPDAAKPVAVADVPAAAGRPLELPLVLPPHAVQRIDLKPERVAPLEVSVSASRFAWYGGGPLTLTVTIRNRTQMPQPLDMGLSGSLPGIVPPPLAHRGLGTLPPQGIRVVRYQLEAPVVARDTEAVVNVQAGTDARASLAVRLTSPLAITLETPRIDLDSPGERGEATLTLANHGSVPLAVRLRAPDGTRQSVSVPPGGRSIRRQVAVTVPSADPGIYLVPIEVEGAMGARTVLPVLVGLPIPCRYAVQKPTIDGDLTEWADAAPMGMGQREQVHAKDWRGPTDLSAYAYAKWDEQFFYFACAVTDDVFFQPYKAEEMERGDSVAFALCSNLAGPTDRSGYGPGDHAFGLALLKGTKAVLRRLGPVPSVGRGTVAVRRVGTRTYYEAAIPWSELGPAVPKAGATFGFSVLVNDNDGQGRGTIEWGGGLAGEVHPGRFPPLRLLR